MINEWTTPFSILLLDRSLTIRSFNVISGILAGVGYSPSAEIVFVYSTAVGDSAKILIIQIFISNNFIE